MGVLGGAALWLGWPWLVVAGIAPILITILPCLIMCGAMCAFNMCSKKQPAAKTADASPGTWPAGALAGAPGRRLENASSSAVADEITPAAALKGMEPSASPQTEIGPRPVPGFVAEIRTPA